MDRAVRMWPSERSETRDPLTGTRVVRLTSARSHSCHLYFTEDGFFDGGRQLLIGVDRGGAWNMAAYQLDSGELRQVTDRPSGSRLDIHGALQHRTERFYCWAGPELLEVDLRAAVTRILWRCPDGLAPGMVGADADARRVWVAVTQPPTDKSGQAYGAYREHFETKPLSRLYVIDVTTGAATLAHEDRAWFTHVNPSPTVLGLVLFCHEGPWDAVQRIWGYRDGRVWPVRPRDDTWGVGHEYWCADGETVGYHARRIGDDARHLLGFWHVIEDRPVIEAETDIPTQHAHANDTRRVVTDSIRSRGDRILLVDRAGDVFAPARVLCTHDASRHHHYSHAHPRFSPDGRWVVFTSDRLGYSDVWMAEVPDDITTLPLAKDVPVRRFYWM